MNNITNLRNSLRMPGLATGLDTTTMVNDLMRVERMRVERLEQDKQLIEWRQEAYRAVTTRLQTFRRDFFDRANPDKFMLRAAATRIFDVESTNVAVVTATASAEARTMRYTINRVMQLATPPEAQGANHISRPLTGLVQHSANTVNLTGRSFALVVDGVRRTINFTRDYIHSDVRDAAGVVVQASELPILVSDLNTALEREFGRGRVVATIQGSTITLAMHDLAGLIVPSTSRLEVLAGTLDALPVLGLQAGQTNRQNLDRPLNTLTLATPLDFSQGPLRLSINGIGFEFGATATLSEVMRTVNRSQANVTISYNSVTDSFSLQGTRTGAAERIVFVQTQGNLLQGLGISPQSVSGNDAVAEINGLTVRRGQNSFLMDGVNFSLNAVSNTPASITVTANVDKAVARLRDFVTQYNEVLDSLNSRLNEERHADFRPLTEAQRSAMNETDIKAWEERAKSGLLNNNPLLQRLVREVRQAVMEPVSGVGLNLASIGITTRSFQENGRLHLDESRLRQALTTNGEQVSRLISQSSEIAYSPNLSVTARAERRANSGVMFRLADILEDNIRTTRDLQNRRGLLLERAGIVGDSSAVRNTLAEQMNRLNTRISQVNETLQRREDRYWRQFAALERAMSTMNSQSNWLSAQFAPRQQ